MRKYKGGIFFDIDGTLINLENGIDKPTEKTLEAIKKLQDEGYLIGIATGRMHNYIPDSILDLNLEVYISSNGAVSKYNGENIVNDIINPDLLEESLDFLDENGCRYVVACDDVSYFNGEKNERFPWINKNVFPLDNKRKNASKVTTSYTEEFLCKFKDKYKDRLYVLLHRQNMDFGDITVSKASGIKKTAEYFGIDFDNIYTFGDDYNDFEMISEFKHGVAMTPHVKELEEVADYITDSVENEGIYKAFEHYGLI